ncbi:unnamed protein product [Prorocentrum cordatum]|uniref:Uncharacterized protein n=1 Tax=Prorocentrum cordatum TaxID=2364126 RepID=A0ABN9WTB5_9DINO|nr:unnamed protein product [Polarella glacialis]
MDSGSLLGILGLSSSQVEEAERAATVVDAREAFTEVLAEADIEALYVYHQPGEARDLNLSDWLGVPWDVAALGQPCCAATQRLWRLNRIVERLASALGDGADWVGIYRVVDGLHSQCLLKEAYRGSVSRGIFPLTDEFAKGSNNSTCAMQRRATIVGDTSVLKQGQPYYE